MKQVFIALIIILASFSCKKDDNPAVVKSGYFVLTELKNPGLKSAYKFADEPILSEFYLGDLKASNKFYFILTNGGDNPIFDIKLETDNSQFIITPVSISALNSDNTGGGDSFIPLISLGILHGTQLNGVGYTSILPMGENTSLLTITGKTIENLDTIKLKSEFDISVTAKIMDISLFSNSVEIDLTKPDGSTMAGGGLPIMRSYFANSSTQKVSIKNIGNVVINVRVVWNINAADETEFSLSPDQSSEVELKEQFTTFVLDSDGTITDNSRIQLHNDGKGYFGIMKFGK